MSSLLYDNTPILITSQIATVFGLSKAVFIHLILDSCTQNESVCYSDDGEINLDECHYFRDDNWWCCLSIPEIYHQAPYFGSEKTIQRIMKDLSDQGILVKANYNKHGFNKTNWYRIDCHKLSDVISGGAK